MELLHLGTRPVWMAPEITHINRLPMRATLFPFPDELGELDIAPDEMRSVCSCRLCRLAEL